MFKQNYFYLNGLIWKIRIVNPRSSMLVDRTNTRNIAVTDPVRKTIYVSSALSGESLVVVLIHELGHCAMVSFNLLDDIHRMVRPEYWFEAEEWLCNFLADYGIRLFSIAYELLGDYSLQYIIYKFEQLVA